MCHRHMVRLAKSLVCRCIIGLRPSPNGRSHAAQVQQERRCWNRHSPKAQYFSSLKVKLAVKEIKDLINGSLTFFASMYLLGLFTHILCYLSATWVTIDTARVSARELYVTYRTGSFLCRQRIRLNNFITSCLWT